MHQTESPRALAVVVADEAIARLVQPRLQARGLPCLASEVYGEIAAQLAPDEDGASWPALGLLLVDMRAALGERTMIRRCHIAQSLLGEHTASGGTWPPVVLLIDALQTDPAWRAAYPVARALLESRDDRQLALLEPWDDGSWAAQIHHAVDAALPRSRPLGSTAVEVVRS
jgi:hypothetical protein